MAKASNGKPSRAKTEYQKERERIQRFIRRAEKRGYKFEGKVLPDIPKRVTKQSVERLKKLDTKALYAKSTYYDPILDKRVTGTEEQKLVRSRASKKAAQTRKAKKDGVKTGNDIPHIDDVIIDNIYDLIKSWQPSETWSKSYTKLKERDKNILESILDGAISSLGRNQVARNLQARAEEIPALVWHILYGSSDFKWGDIQGDIAAIAAIIYGRRLTVAESMDIQDEIDSEIEYE